ncbi:MAG: nucleotidyltransferase family protein [Pseudomonadota bacterium]
MKLINELRVEAIVLAAGLSTRMGSDKMALRFCGQTVLNRTLIEALKSWLGRIVIVTRPGLDVDMTMQFSCFLNHDVTITRVLNFWPEEGMSLSIRLGLTQLGVKARAAMIILADQIFLNTLTINKLISESLENSDKIIVPTILKRRTTPVIFPESFFDELRKISGDKGGKEILARNPNMIHTVELGKAYNDIDIDTPEDYSKIVSKLNHFDRV